MRAKDMGVSVGLPVDRVWNGGSDLQAGVEIYYWEHPEFWLISSSQNDPILGPQAGGRAVARSQQENRKNHEKDAQPAKIKRKIDFSDLRNPQKHFTPLFGEVEKFRTLTEKAEQQSRDGDEVERCMPQNP